MRALREMRVPCVVLGTDGYDKALEYMNRGGEFASRRGEDPDLVLLEADSQHGAASDFIRKARFETSCRPCPIVVLAPGASARDLECWYSAGASSVLVADGDELPEALKSLSWYWLAHNRTPKQR
ncbi:MAG: hypothetical protein QOJ65_1608 [Fimbriimonadaceae bacterium]|jgi:DNA-binding NarL/FixJ family response regulator|nr:hypothetical protein [Fimbriimonadaceae bacterium]